MSNTTKKRARKQAKRARKHASSKREHPLKAGADEVDKLLKAAEANPDENTAPPTEEELQEMLDTAVLGSYIDGQPAVCGTVLRPITSACMTMLKRTENGLVSGLALEDIEDTILHSAKFVVLWRDTGDDDEDQIDEARRLAKPGNADELEGLAYKWLDGLHPSKLADITNEAIFALRDAMSTQVEPIPHKDDDLDDDEPEDEVEGND